MYADFIGDCFLRPFSMKSHIVERFTTAWPSMRNNIITQDTMSPADVRAV
jgi:hypothetical protein